VKAISKKPTTIADEVTIKLIRYIYKIYSKSYNIPQLSYHDYEGTDNS
jgi:hypothetical protein